MAAVVLMSPHAPFEHSNPHPIMSIHAQLSPEALDGLRRQTRNSTLLSIVTAAMSVLLIGGVLGLFLLDAYIRETPTIVTYSASLPETSVIEAQRVNTTLQRKPAQPSSAQARVIASATASPTAIPVPDMEIPTPSTMFGDTDDFGFGFGNELASAGGFQGIPQTMRKRCSLEDRLARLKETGGNPQTEAAVEKGLEWLQSTQNPDGSWGRNQYVSAYTGLGLLGFLGRCETPMSMKYGGNVLNAIVYLVDLGVRNDGKLSRNPHSNSWPYEHAIATYALAEACTFTHQIGINIPNLERVVKQAGQFIIDHQNANGGWGYSYTKQGGHVDTSVTAWQLQALKAMDYTGIPFEGLARSVSRAIDYMESMQNANGGFGYRGPNSPASANLGYFTMTGGGVLSLQLWGKSNSAAVRNGARYIEQNSRFAYDER